MLKKIYFGLIAVITIIAVVLLLGYGLDWGVRRWKLEQKLSDIEIFNGTVAKKNSQLEQVNYSCNPQTVYSPSTKATKTVYQNCTREVVNYSIELSFGDKIDYGTLNKGQSAPKLWQEIKPGQPASVPKNYKNYIKASETTILKRKAFLDSYQYAKLVPEIPKVYDKIKVNQVIQISHSDGYTKYEGEQMDLFNTQLSRLNGKLGESKQLNTIVILLPDYMNDMIFAVDQKWIGGNKNEVILFVNLAKDKSITRVQSLSWSTQNGEIESKLDNILVYQIKQLNTDQQILETVDYIQTTLESTFDRKSMKDYEYLLQEVKSRYGF